MFIRKYKNFSLLFKIFIISLLFQDIELASANTSNVQKYEHCATIFKNEGLTGDKISIINGGFFPDIKNSQILGQNFGSLQIKAGCRLTLCKESNFKGQCQNLGQNLTKMTSQFSQIQSASCSCENDCSCEGIQMRLGECGRAYVDSDCGACHSQYIDLKGSSGQLGTDPSRIRSLVVRSGCTLRIYDSENFSGNSTQFQTTQQNFAGPLNSYQCTCSAGSNGNILQTRTVNFADWINVPSNEVDIRKLLKYEKHPALIAALESVKNNRSPTNAYLLLMGLPGSGKSSAAQILFSNPNVTEVSKPDLHKDDINEFTIPIKVDQLGHNNSKLIIIDTPGIPDKNGNVENDAKFLATFEKYLDSHPELNNSIPNFVLIFAKFGDKKISGAGSSFVRMLEHLGKFRDRITDSKFSNVIFVLSHFMSESKDVLQNTEPKIQEFIKSVESVGLFPKPIKFIVADNWAEKLGLRMVNGYFEMPNGELYPRNLYDEIQKAAQNGGDPIGGAIIEQAFSNLDGAEIFENNIPLVSNNNSNYIKILADMKKSHKIYDTDVSKLLQSKADELENFDKKILKFIQRFLYKRNIFKFEQIPTSDAEIIKLFRGIKLNEESMNLVEKTFGFKFKKIQISVGKGYNILKDKIVQKSPFKSENNYLSDIGISIPANSRVEKLNEEKNIFEIFPNYENYLRDKMYKYNIEGENTKSLNGSQIRLGYNIESINNTYLSPINGIKEFKRFKFTLINDTNFNQEFLDVLKSLKEFDKNNVTNVKQWENFFENYGTHAVQSDFAGGKIMIKNTGNYSTEISSSRYFSKIIDYLDGNIFDQTKIQIKISQDKNDTKSILEEYSINISHDDKKNWLKLSDISEDRLIEILRFLRTETFEINPMPVGEPELVSYKHLLRSWDTKISESIDLATIGLYELSFGYRVQKIESQKFPSPPRDDQPPRKNQTPKVLRKNIQSSTVNGEGCLGVCQLGLSEGMPFWCTTKSGWDFCSPARGFDAFGRQCLDGCSLGSETHTTCRTNPMTNIREICSKPKYINFA